MNLRDVSRSRRLLLSLNSYPLPVEALSLDYDIAVGSMTEEGWISDDTLREEVKTRAELINATKVPDVETIFDYTLIKKAYADLKKDGWKPTR